MRSAFLMDNYEQTAPRIPILLSVRIILPRRLAAEPNHFTQLADVVEECTFNPPK